MSLAEVQKFIIYIKQNRESLEKYNEKLLETGSYMFTDPSLMSESYPPVMTISENPEDNILEKIIHLDDRTKEDKKAIEDKEKLSKRIVNKWDSFVDDILFEGKTKEIRITEKRHHLFKKLSAIAKEEKFEVTQDDLEYYIGKSVSRLIDEYPKSDPVQILEKLLDDFEDV